MTMPLYLSVYCFIHIKEDSAEGLYNKCANISASPCSICEISKKPQAKDLKIDKI